MADALASMKAGEVDLAIIIGGNPVLTAPAGWDLENAIASRRGDSSFYLQRRNQ